MTIDVEDYFQVSAFETVVNREDWHARESRVCANTERLLEILDDASVTATFFVLGWVAERFPSLSGPSPLKDTKSRRTDSSTAWFTSRRRNNFATISAERGSSWESVTGMPVVGYRAPSYSIIRESMWALDVLIDEGYLFDSSIYPIRHDRYGIPDAPRHVHQIARRAGQSGRCQARRSAWRASISRLAEGATSDCCPTPGPNGEFGGSMPSSAGLSSSTCIPGKLIRRSPGFRARS